MRKKIWWGLLIFILLVLGIWFYSIGLRSSKISEEEKVTKPEIFQEKEGERVILPKAAEPIKVRKPAPLPRKKVVIPSDYEPVSPEKEGTEDFAEERKRESQRKDRGIPTG